jgi:hypothetical protein
MLSCNIDSQYRSRPGFFKELFLFPRAICIDQAGHGPWPRPAARGTVPIRPPAALTTRNNFSPGNPVDGI